MSGRAVPRPIAAAPLLAILILVAACGAGTERTGRHRTDDGERNSIGRDLAYGHEDGTGPQGHPLVDRGLEPAAVIVAHATVSALAARVAPDEDAAVVAQLSNPTPVGGPLAFQLVGATAGRGEWVEVLLPVRPNGTTGWVPRGEVELSQNPYRIEVDTGDHLLEVFHQNRSLLRTTVAIGTGETPTPIGRFYIIELLQPPVPTGPYGTFAFGLSGFSETLTSFAGGDGVIGIHGTNDPSSLGTDVSHGCIRVANETIESMAGVIPLGTPVIIRT